MELNQLKEFFSPFDVLFKMDSKGELRFWVCVQKTMDNSLLNLELHIYHGRVTSFTGQEAPNETLPYVGVTAGSDATTERKRRYTLQRNRKGYTDEVPTAPPDKAMLALDYNEHKDFFEDGELVYVQPKLDGMRCIAIDGKLFSRDGEPITGMPHIKPPPGKWDGELYHHEWKFEQIISVAKSKSPHYLHEKLKYHVFDSVDYESPFSLRYCAVMAEFGSYQYDHIVPVPTHACHYSEVHINRLLNEFLEQKYEGIMIRSSEGKYEPNRRTKHLQKYKPWKDDWFPLVGIKEGKGSAKGHAIFVCKLPNGNTFDCNPSFSMPRRRQIWLNKDNYINKVNVHVRFQMYTENLVPRFPQGVDLCNIQEPTAQPTTGQEKSTNYAQTEKSDQS